VKVRRFGLLFPVAFAWALLLGAVAPLPAQTFKVLYSFAGVNDGGNPNGPLAQDAKGNLYSVTNVSQGGTGAGTVFRLSPSSKLTVLHPFGGEAEGDGAWGSSGVIRDAAGNLYGTTWGGGYNNQGVVFEVSASGKERVLHRFTGGIDGSEPTAGLVRDSAGNLYGTTSSGGKCAECGAVFMVNKNGKEKVLYRFKGPPDAGHVLTGDLVLDANGNLYGVSYFGGLTTGCIAPQAGCGTAFELSPNGRGGWKERVLYRFKGGTDGAYPHSGLVRDAEGNFYGSTDWGGNTGCRNSGCGTVFKLDSTGKETVLYRFTGGSDGSEPGNVLALDTEGNLYGTAPTGGSDACRYGCGTAFKLDTSSGKLTVLHAFDGTDGAHPSALLLNAAGKLDGVTQQGGSSNWGAVFEITP
jgi:uncharacterized repeat protein (TIGR03803 family)